MGERTTRIGTLPSRLASPLTEVPVDMPYGGMPALKTIGNAEDSDWLFRLIQQISQLSQGALLTDSDRADFESAQMRLIEVLRQCNDARRGLFRIADEHIEEIAAGKGVFVNGAGLLVIDDDIKPRINRAINGFFVAARTALYHLFGQKPMAGKTPAKSILEIITSFNFGFVFMFNEATFEQEAKKYLDAVPGVRSKSLIDTIRNDRTSWTLGLQEIRDTIIHNTEYDGLKMIYKPNGIKVAVGFPRLNQTDVFELVEIFWGNLVDLCEEMILVALSTRMPPLIAVDRIPEDQRDSDLPYRWRGILLQEPTV